MIKLILILLFPILAFSNVKPNPFFSLSVGMNNVSYTEVASTLKSSDGDTTEKTQASSSVSIISLNVEYTYPIQSNQAVTIRGLTPLISNADRMFSGGVGYQYYFGNKLVSDIEIQSADGSYVHLAPKMRYFVGGVTDVSYLFYTSDTSKKTDLLFQIGPSAGILYRWKKKYDIKGTFEYQMGYGSVVTTTSMKIIGGLTYQF